MTVGQGKWGAALVVSAAIHSGVAGWLYQTDDETNIAGGSPVEISLLGDAFQNETMAGDLSDTVETAEQEVVDTSETETTELPEEVITKTSAEFSKAEAVEPATTPTKVDSETTASVQPETLKAIDTKALTAQSSEAEPAQQTPSEPIALAEVTPMAFSTARFQLADINIASLQPSILSEKTTSRPLLEMVPETVEPEELVTPDEVTPDNSDAELISPTIKKIEPQEPEQTLKPTENKVQKKKVSKKKIRKKKAVKKKSTSGSNGKGKRNARAGDSKGSKTAKTNSVGKSKGKKSRKNGNASASNYKGKVRRKVKRSFRRPRGGSRLRKDAVVRFVLSTSGAVRSVRLVRSSGSKKLDQAALSAVRRASPFPKPPGGIGGASLNFTLPFGI